MSTSQDVINQARWQLRDVIGNNYNFSDNELLAYVNDGQRDVFKRRPESVITDNSTVTATFGVNDASLGGSLTISDNYFDCVVDYTVASALSKNAANIGLGDGVSARRWIKYENSVTQ